jgi:hypothetical protein
MITYEALRKAATEEKANNRLTRLPDGFFSEVKDYLDMKAQLHEKEDKWELDSAKNTLQDLMEIRERKVLLSALFGSRTGVVPENMLPVEREFFDRIVSVIKEFMQRKEEGLNHAPPMSTVKSLEDIPAFVGVDMKNYGPFAKGEAATMPQENARLLMKKGSAEAEEAKETVPADSESA